MTVVYQNSEETIREQYLWFAWVISTGMSGGFKKNKNILCTDWYSQYQVACETSGIPPATIHKFYGFLGYILRMQPSPLGKVRKKGKTYYTCPQVISEAMICSLITQLPKTMNLFHFSCHEEDKKYLSSMCLTELSMSKFRTSSLLLHCALSLEFAQNLVESLQTGGVTVSNFLTTDGRQSAMKLPGYIGSRSHHEGGWTVLSKLDPLYFVSQLEPLYLVSKLDPLRQVQLV